MSDTGIADIPESFFEYRADLSVAMFSAWTLPNPLVPSVLGALAKWNVGLSDVTWNNEAKSFKDLQLTFNVAQLDAAIKVGVDSVLFIALNPDWEDAPNLVSAFDEAIKAICKTGNTQVRSQEISLAMHVKPGSTPFVDVMARLVNKEVLGPGEMYGFSVYRDTSSLVIDKSIRYEKAVFLRLTRRFAASSSFEEIADILYKDELKALDFLGLRELLER